MKEDKAIGTPVFTWQSHVTDLVGLVQRMESTKELLALAEALDAVAGIAKNRRHALRALAGKSAYGMES